jgi:hypothetical protein
MHFDEELRKEGIELVMRAKSKNVKAIFLLGFALTRGRRGFADDSRVKIFPLKLPQFLPARQKMKVIFIRNHCIKS